MNSTEVECWRQSAGKYKFLNLTGNDERSNLENFDIATCTDNNERQNLDEPVGPISE